jgi:PilZ domain
MSQSEDKRAYFRVELRQPMSSQIKIISINGRQIDSRSTTVRVYDIGGGGLKFSSFLNFPITANALFRFDFSLLETSLSLRGTLVRQVKTKRNGFEYGVAFLLEEKELNVLIKLLNDLALRLHHRQSLKGTTLCPYDSFCSGCSCSKQKKCILVE